MLKPARCDCPDCHPSLPSLARTGAEEFVEDVKRALDGLRDLALGDDARDAVPDRLCGFCSQRHAPPRDHGPIAIAQCPETA